MLSIIITASFIKSHPSIDFIKKTLESLKFISADENTKIILAHDYHESDEYKNYFKNLEKYVVDKPSVQIVKRLTRGCLTGNVRHAFQFVTTPFVLIIQHDLPFVKQFNIHKVIEDMTENTKLKHVRFNKRSNVKFGSDSLNDLFGKQVQCANYTYTRTPSWSDNNHLCKSDYYRNTILKECKDGSFMESFLIARSKNEAIHDIYGTYLFGPINESAFIEHIDGRRNKDLP